MVTCKPGPGGVVEEGQEACLSHCRWEKPSFLRVREELSRVSRVSISLG